MRLRMRGYRWALLCGGLVTLVTLAVPLTSGAATPAPPDEVPAERFQSLLSGS